MHCSNNYNVLGAFSCLFIYPLFVYWFFPRRSSVKRNIYFDLRTIYAEIVAIVQI